MVGTIDSHSVTTVSGMTAQYRCQVPIGTTHSSVTNGGRGGAGGRTQFGSTSGS